MLKIFKITLILILIYIIFFSFQSALIGEPHLDWPDQVLIGPILKLKGFLLNDFHTNGYVNTPVMNTVNIFSFLMPKDHDKILSLFINFTIVHRSIYIILSLYLISTYSVLIINLNRQIRSKFLVRQHVTNFISLLTIYIVLQSNKFNSYINDILFGGRIADVTYLYSGNHPRLISLSLAIISLSIPLTLELHISKIKKKYKYLALTVSLLFFIASIYIHPVSPLFIIPIGFFLPILVSKKNKLIFDWFKISYLKIIVWFTYSLILINVYPQNAIENSLFFKVYVQERHPHHYLASSYLSSKYHLLFFFINFIVLLFISFNQYKYKKSIDFLIKNIFVGLLSFIFINSVQIITVDILKIPLFMKLGISWLNVLFNFYYVTTLVIFFTIKFKETKIINSLRINKYINLKLKDLPFNLIIFILIILSISSLNLSYQSNINLVKNSLERKIANIANKYELSNEYEYLISDKLESKLLNMREYGLLNMYSDKYFPFNADDFEEWYQRKNKLNSFKECLNNKKSNKCSIDDNKLIYLSEDENLKIGESIIKENFQVKKLSFNCRLKRACSQNQNIVFTPLISK